MSGFNGMQNWEQYWESNRDHIEKMFGPLSARSRQIKQMSNRQVSSELYKMILAGELDEKIAKEAAERLGAARELTTTKLGEN